MRKKLKINFLQHQFSKEDQLVFSFTVPRERRRFVPSVSFEFFIIQREQIDQSLTQQEFKGVFDLF